ncbi:MAG: glycosyltransferase family 2 protein [Burkholderiales bacterium]|nr:glycosyltransferase family 2 protein [Burkholderiales bacterium]
MSPSRNAPCPCGSGKRYKNCCGALSQAQAPEGQQPPPSVQLPVAAQPSAAVRSTVTAQPPAADGELACSLILPYYRKLAEFRLVLPMNLPYLARPGLEVIIVMDDAAEEAELLQLLGQYSQVQWRVIVNDSPHDWRPPCKAINVGIRHARGRYLFVASPESVFVGDVLHFALEAVKDFPRGFAVGRVGFARFQDLEAWRLPLSECFERTVMAQGAHLDAYYGSICGPRAAFEAINGYDESFTTWGSDDDNLRIRLEMAGYTLLACPPMRLLHLAFEARNGGENPRFAYDPKMERLRCSPDSALANSADDWGRDFARLAYTNNRAQPQAVAGPAGRVAALTTAEPKTAPPPGSIVPTGSRRRCRACGRLVHYEPRGHCAHCTPLALHWSRPRTAASGAVAHVRSAGPRIACVMQLRNENLYLQGCLEHLRGHVDAVIALDDGSTDDTMAILRGEPALVADCLSNPARDDAEHTWNEVENRRRLLTRARELGFDWVLCCDADERYELALLKNLRAIAASFAPTDLVYLSVALRELWNGPRHYRADGIWGSKSRIRMFALPPVISFVDEPALHGQWYPQHLRKYGRQLDTQRNLYHLKMIRAEDRLRRRDLYKRLDPGGQFQSIDYDYLVQEGPEMQLQELAVGREYDFDTLPGTLKAIL